MILLFRNKRVVIAGDGESKNQSVHVEDVNDALLSCVDVSFPDIGKAKKILGWKPKHTIKEALIDSVEFLSQEYL